MSRHTQLLLWVFIATLPACYWTPFPCLLTAILFGGMYFDDALIQRESILNRTQKASGETDFQKQTLQAVSGLLDRIIQVETDFAELRSEVNGLNLRAGLGKK